MPTAIPRVFLCSVFDEFKTHRQHIKDYLREGRPHPCIVDDFSENQADEEPPAVLSQNAARSADIMVMLLGRRYGSIPPGYKRSYNHLEFDAASERNSNTIILPYFFDDPSGPAASVADPRAAELRREILSRHTVSRFSLETDPRDVAIFIVQDVIRKWIFLTAAERDEDADLWMIPDAEFEQDGEGEIEEHDRRLEAEPLLQLVDDTIGGWTERQLRAQPARVAAAEQKQEASSARQIQEWRLAIWHLHRALGWKPWDVAALYWSARLRLLSGRMDDLQRALKLAMRAARVARKERGATGNLPLAACHIVAAQAAGQLSKPAEAIQLAQEAVEAAGWFWRTPYELARQHALAGAKDEAKKWLRRAFFIQPRSLKEAATDVAFRGSLREYQELRRAIKGELQGDVGNMIRGELGLWHRFAALVEKIPEGARSPDAVEISASTNRASAELEKAGEGKIITLLGRAEASFDRHVEALRQVARQLASLLAYGRMLADDRDQLEADLVQRTEGIKHQIQSVKSGATPVAFKPDGYAVRIGWLTALAWVGITVLLHARLLVVLPTLVAAALIVLFAHAYATDRGRENARDKKVRELEMSLRFTQAAGAEEQRAAQQNFDSVLDVLSECVRLFTDGVSRFERSTLRRPVYCRTAAVDRAKGGDLVRVKQGQHGDRFTLDGTLLPESMDEIFEISADALHHHLYRVVPGSQPPVASRRAVYFS